MSYNGSAHRTILRHFSFKRSHMLIETFYAIAYVLAWKEFDFREVFSAYNAMLV
jgi:hypothetical protein